MKRIFLYYLASILILLDLIITLNYWYMESNPIVIYLGKELFIIIHILGILFFIYIKNIEYIIKSNITTICISILNLIYSIAVIGNLWVVI